MKKIFTLLLIATIFFTFNSLPSARDSKKKSAVGEPGLIEENILTQNDPEINTEQEAEVTPIPLPDLNVFTTSINSATTVADSIADFISKRTDKINSYEFISSEDKRKLLEELSDINTRLTRVKDGLTGMQLETFMLDMPEIQTELESINSQLLELNETQKLTVLSLITKSYLEDHKSFYTNAVNLFEEHKEYYTQESDINDLLDDIEDIIFKLEGEYNDNRWEDMLDNEKDLMDILNQEAEAHTPNR
ncbi:hypothetical protein KBD45_04575 [Candidatus Dojkabacteria bacterium]|nr:hypothetical protein [Candidatus Dojkabacteria bacterium]